MRAACTCRRRTHRYSTSRRKDARRLSLLFPFSLTATARPSSVARHTVPKEPSPTCDHSARGDSSASEKPDAGAG